MISCLLHAPSLGLAPTQACALTGNATGNLLVCSSALNPLTTPANAFSSLLIEHNQTMTLQDNFTAIWTCMYLYLSVHLLVYRDTHTYIYENVNKIFHKILVFRTHQCIEMIMSWPSRVFPWSSKLF